MLLQLRLCRNKNNQPPFGSGTFRSLLLCLRFSPIKNARVAKKLPEHAFIPYFLLFLTIITKIITSLITFAPISGESTTSHGHRITPSNRRATRIIVTSNTRSTSTRFPFFIDPHLPYSKNCNGSTGVPFTWTSKCR